MSILRSTLTGAIALVASSGAAFAACDEVVFSDVGWTDITTTTSATKQVLEALGYDVDVKILSVPVTFASLEKDDVDVFLGNWIPAQNAAVACAAYAGWAAALMGDSAAARAHLVTSEGLRDLNDNPFAAAIHAGLGAEGVMDMIVED